MAVLRKIPVTPETGRAEFPHKFSQLVTVSVPGYQAAVDHLAFLSSLRFKALDSDKWLLLLLTPWTWWKASFGFSQEEPNSVDAWGKGYLITWLPDKW